MKIQIPDIGDKLIITAPWTFKLYSESRNDSLILRETGLHYKREYPVKTYINVTLPIGTELLIDRIYIRKGAKEFSSMSFFMDSKPNKIRFWAKLKDINNMDAVICENNNNITWEPFSNITSYSITKKNNDFKLEMTPIEFKKESEEYIKNYDVHYWSQKPFESTKISCSINGIKKYICEMSIEKWKIVGKPHFQTSFIITTYYASYSPIINYILYDLDNNEIIRYKSIASMKKYVKSLVEN